MQDASDPTKIIMVVDGDTLARMAIAEYLRDCGYSVIEAANAAEARAVLAAGHDVVVLLMDMHIPSAEDGFALAREVRADHPQIAVIRTSSAAKLADTAGALCDDGPLAKPYHPQELLRRIHALQQRKQPPD